MSSSIWTRSAARSRIRPLAASPWRVVEAQHHISTRKLVDSDDEQMLLERLIDAAKPPAPPGRLHYLLSTPFRYPPLPYGSRFGSRWEPGLWYGADALPTALAEVAYYRFVFLEGTSADLGPIESDLTAFRVPVAARRGLDLSASGFDRWRGALGSRTSYRATQPFGAAMRESGVEAFRYPSTRDPGGGTNVGLFTPKAFASRRPRGVETWHAVATPTVVEFRRRDYFTSDRARFARAIFLVSGRLPAPALGA